MAHPLDPGVAWLLASSDPAVRNLARTDLLGEPFDETAPLRSPRVQALLVAHRGHPYGNKWRGAHWRLVSLVELGVGAEPAVLAAVEQVLGWIATPGPRTTIADLERRHASMEGNALAVCSRLGLAGDPRVVYLRDVLLAAQWPDGGWNCDRRPKARHSSFHESLATLWGLHEFNRATGDTEAGAAAERAEDFFLRHRLFRSEHSGRIADREFIKLHYPPYWHYDILQAMLVLSRRQSLDDQRCGEALDLLESKRRPDGTWEPQGYRYWLRQGSERVNGDVVDWGRDGPNEMLTLNALRVLKAAGRAQWKRPSKRIGKHQDGSESRVARSTPACS
jgi:hypothetical protein